MIELIWHVVGRGIVGILTILDGVLELGQLTLGHHVFCNGEK